jgi:hypothetical protein
MHRHSERAKRLIRDRLCRDFGSELEALEHVAQLRDADDQIPKIINFWLRIAFSEYVSGRAKTMDAALGLTKRGAGDPRRKKREAIRWIGPTSEVRILRALGASAEDAAALVHQRVEQGLAAPPMMSETAPDRFEAETLSKKKGTPEPLMALARRRSLEAGTTEEIDELLSHYPDGELANTVKRQILRKRRPTSAS